MPLFTVVGNRETKEKSFSRKKNRRRSSSLLLLFVRFLFLAWIEMKYFAVACTVPEYNSYSIIQMNFQIGTYRQTQSGNGFVSLSRHTEQVGEQPLTQNTRHFYHFHIRFLRASTIHYTFIYEYFRSLS